MAWFLVQGYAVSGLRPDNTLPGPQPPFPGGPVDPGYSPPWARPGLPVYPDQGLPGGQPYPDQGLPGSQPRPDHGLPPFPSHPIAPGGPPLGMWGPNDPRPTPPIYIPITPPPGSGLSPEHPIYIPVYPDNTLPGPQPYPDQGLPGSQPHPDNTLPGAGSGGQAAMIAKIKKAVDFWTGNLPPPPTTPTPTPTA